MKTPLLKFSWKMPEKLPEKLRGFSKWITCASLRQLVGARWEARRCGDLSLGLWRINLANSRARWPTRGKRPARLVLIPGLGDSPVSWFGVLALLFPLLRKRYDELVLLDFPGFLGLLSRKPCFPSMNMLMGATEDALDSLMPEAILGHSLGGWLASHYAAECGLGKRAIISRETYSGPSLVMLGSPAGRFAEKGNAVLVRNRFMEASRNGRESLRRLMFSNESIWFKLIASDLSKFVNREDLLGLVSSIHSDHLLSDDQLAAVSGKVRLIWGENDALIPPALAKDWLRQIRGAHAFLVRGAGHILHVEKTRAVADLLGHILQGTEMSDESRERGWELFA